MKKINLCGYGLTDLENLMTQMGQKNFTGRQLFKWIYNLNIHDFNTMTNLSLALRERLGRQYYFEAPKIRQIQKSSDGTEKFLFELADGALIESVLIPDHDRKTACVSTQVGCPLGCRFCATGLMGFDRHLTPGEIVGQLISLRKAHGKDAFNKLVFMGMGEPLLNYDNLLKSIEIISSEIGLSLSAKKMTVSTIGVIPQIYALADSGLKVNLAVSIHAADNAQRAVLMPSAKAFPIEKIMDACRYFTTRRKKRVTFESVSYTHLRAHET